MDLKILSSRTIKVYKVTNAECLFASLFEGYLPWLCKVVLAAFTGAAVSPA